MNDSDITARLLFANYTVYQPTETDMPQDRLLNDMRGAESDLLILSLLPDKEALPKQEEIFNRLLSKLPNKNVSTRIIYTHNTTLASTTLRELTNIKHLLVCGVELEASRKVEMNKNYNMGKVQVLITKSIEDIDRDAALKKAMWSEWIKQFKPETLR